MQYETIFHQIYQELKSLEDTGHVADYIPELAHVNPDQFGVHLSTINGESYAFGDAEKRFSIQSIAKVFAFVLAYSKIKSDIWKRMDLEPAGTPFNSLVQLEHEDRKSTRLNSSHVRISYAVFCLKKKKRNNICIL